MIDSGVYAMAGKGGVNQSREIVHVGSFFYSGLAARERMRLRAPARKNSYVLIVKRLRSPEGRDGGLVVTALRLVGRSHANGEHGGPIREAGYHL